MDACGWKTETQKQIVQPVSSDSVDDAIDEFAETDLEGLGHAQIVKLIEARFPYTIGYGHFGSSGIHLLAESRRC